MKQPFRQLRGYSLDPGFSTRLDTASINEITYHIKWEELSKGPCGDYFEVVDYDPASNCFYDPVDLNAENVLAQNGLDPSEGNPKFHQQFVYTVAMKTLEHFEQSLGRKIIWSPRKPSAGASNSNDLSEGYVDRLRIYPHAFRDANAYYDPDKKAILFGYFEAAPKVQGNNFPGGVIFTCLSPDIVAHEVTHAILDSIHPRFIENTNPDVAAFHEAFADIVALLQRFTIPQLVEHQIAQTRGNLEEFSFLGELATQFGNALQGSRGALRGAIGKVDSKGIWKKYKPNPEDYKTIFEPHERGAILVATVFEAFIRLYNNTTADLLRIATNGTGILQPGAIHPDLVKRLAAAACEIAERLLHICIRALDYCPPHDITFGDYLRALITADIDTSPKDTNGYRLALIEAFRCWGIFPDRVNTLSIESLQWAKPDTLTAKQQNILKYTARFLKSHVRDIVDISTLESNNRKEIYTMSRKVQKELHNLLIYTKRNGTEEADWSDFLQKLGLTNHAKVFYYEDEIITTEKVPKLEVHKVRPVYRIGRDGKLVEQVLVTITQTFRVTNGSLQGAKFRGGCTMVINMSRDYDVEYIIYKNITSDHRFTYQMDYQQGKNASFTALSDSMYEEESGFRSINFAHLHFH
ncbi:MAG: hypothetical protein JWO92_727 [Chitinophagaceae bacterium]|nr:hypothetical protein [Chitinophagaceae bacterium]